MARYPGAVWKPIDRYQPGGAVCVPMVAYRRYCLHTAVSASSSLYGLFATPGRPVAHFYVNAAGTVEQYVDTAYRSSANLNGNHDTISVESQDMGPTFPTWSGSAVPAWNLAQIESLARLAAWAYRTHGIPLDPSPTSRPGTVGVAYHRQGIDPWRVADGEFWSKATGKVCPGDDRLGQIPTVIARARQIAAMTTEDDLPYTEQQLRTIVQSEMLNVVRGDGISGAGDPPLMLDRGYRQAMVEAARQAVAEILVSLPDEVAKRVPPATADQVRQAVADAIAAGTKVVGTLDVVREPSGG